MYQSPIPSLPPDPPTPVLFSLFEHTADFGIRVQSPDLPTLFAEAAEAMFSTLVADLKTARPVEEISFPIEGKQEDELLHDWLNELLFTFSARHMVFSQFKVVFEEKGLIGKAWGEKIDKTRHEIEMEIKAITWHGLKVEKTPEGYLAEVIVDI